MRKLTERLFVTCASSGATSRWAMRVNSSSQLSTSTTSEARLDLTAHPRLAPRASRQSGVCSLAVPFGGHNPPPWASSPGAAGAPFLTERPVWSAASSNANGEDGREAGVDGSPLARVYLSICSCWLVRPCIRPVGAAFHAPLAIMPFARLRSRSKARTRSARPNWVLLIRRYQPALCISSCPPFPTSSSRSRALSRSMRVIGSL